MSKQRKKQSIASKTSDSGKRVSKKSKRRDAFVKAALSPKNSPKSTEPTSKQARLITMLESPAGATIDAMMKAAGWQQHSVRGFLAGVVRKRLKLNLSSTKIDDDRVYRVAGGGESHLRSSKRAD